MPNYKGHLMAGAVTFAATLYTLNHFGTPMPSVELGGLFLIVTLIGSIFPDIDTKSKMQKYFYVSSALAFPTLLFSSTLNYIFLIAGLCIAIPCLRHRTITHNPFFILGLPGLMVLYAVLFYPSTQQIALFCYIFFVCGALSHIFLDRLFTRIKKILLIK